jgi:arabinose-5-phosphate isomerase
MSKHYREAERVFRAEIEGLEGTLEAIQPDFDRAVELILACEGKVVVTGLGKSGIVGHKIAATLASTGTPALFMSASEALHGDLGIVTRSDVVVMLSNSAATVELARMLPSLKRAEAKLIGIFGKTNTELARACDVVLDASVEKEACPLNLAPMTSSTVSLVIGDALAAALMKSRGFTREDFAVYHPSGSLGRKLLLCVSDVMHRGDQLPKVAEDASFKEVVVEMTRTNLGGVAVCDKNETLLGFISDGDVRRKIIEDEALSLSAAEMMTRNPKTTQPETRLGEVLEIMENPQRQIYILPVVDEDGRYVGIIRMHDILQSEA